VGARTGPLQVRHDVLGGQAQAGAEGRRVHLGDAVDEDHLARDAVGIEHADDLIADLEQALAGV
jgi:O-acetylhomoserine/O-acetylserine sulfhydrylase-like pyridoxal-dependent enzyme